MNYNLFVEPKEQPTEEDAMHLSNCGQVAKYWRHRSLFFKLKDAILDAFGARDGFDAQKWYDMDDQLENFEHAEHIHILQRFVFCGRVFHKPTNDFYYFNFEYQVDKYSANYFEVCKTVKNVIEGKKEYKTDKYSRAVAWASLKHLIRKYGYLLREDRKAA